MYLLRCIILLTFVSIIASYLVDLNANSSDNDFFEKIYLIDYKLHMLNESLKVCEKTNLTVLKTTKHLINNGCILPIQNRKRSFFYISNR